MPKKNRTTVKTYNLRSTILFVLIAVAILVAVWFILPLVKENVGNNSGNLGENSVAFEIVEPMKGEGNLKFHFISVGQADSIFIEFPTGNNMLIDAAESSSVSKVTDYITNLGVSTIDYVLLTHQDSDHAGGMATVFNTFEVKYALRPSVYSTYSPTSGDKAFPTEFNIGASASSASPSSTKTYYEYLKAVYNEEGCGWAAFNKDTDLSFTAVLDETEYLCYVDFLTPTAAVGNIKYNKNNNYSPIISIEYCGFKMILTGDAEKEVENELLSYYSDKDFKSDVLKVGHHGSKTSSTEEFIDSVRPEYSIISCGLDPEKSKYCPWQVTLDRLNNIGSTIYRTDLNGDIVLTVNKTGSFNISTQKTSDYSSILKGYST